MCTTLPISLMTLLYGLCAHLDHQHCRPTSIEQCYCIFSSKMKKAVRTVLLRPLEKFARLNGLHILLSSRNLSAAPCGSCSLCGCYIYLRFKASPRWLREVAMQLDHRKLSQSKWVPIVSMQTSIASAVSFTG